MPSKQTVHGKAITRKTTRVRYFSEKRICLEYKPLAKPKHEYTAWFIGEDGKEAGYDVTRKVYDSLRVAETVHDSASDRKAWEAERARAERDERRYRNSGFVHP